MSQSVCSFKSQDGSKVAIQLYKNHKRTKNTLRVKPKITLQQFRDKIYPNYTKHQHFTLQIQTQVNCYKPITTEAQFRNILHNYNDQKININTNESNQTKTQINDFRHSINAALLHQNSLIQGESRQQSQLGEQELQNNQSSLDNSRNISELEYLSSDVQRESIHENMMHMRTTMHRTNNFRDISYSSNSLSRGLYQNNISNTENYGLNDISNTQNDNQEQDYLQSDNLQINNSIDNQQLSSTNRVNNIRINMSNWMSHIQDNQIRISAQSQEFLNRGNQSINYERNNRQKMSKFFDNPFNTVIAINNRDNFTQTNTQQIEIDQYNHMMIKDSHNLMESESLETYQQNYQNNDLLAQNMPKEQYQQKIQKAIKVQQSKDKASGAFHKKAFVQSQSLVPVIQQIAIKKQEQTALMCVEEDDSPQPARMIPYVFERDPLQNILQSQKKKTIIEDKQLNKLIAEKEAEAKKFLSTNKKINLSENFPFEHGQLIKNMLKQTLQITSRKVTFEMFHKYGPIQEQYKQINFRRKCYECLNHSNGPVYFCLQCKYQYMLCSACEHKFQNSDLKSHKFQNHVFAKAKRWHHLFQEKKVVLIDPIDVDQQALKCQRLIAKQCAYKYKIDRQDYTQTFAQKLTRSLIRLQEIEISNTSKEILALQYNSNKFQEVKQNDGTLSKPIQAVTDDLNVSNIIPEQSLNESTILAEVQDLKALTKTDIFKEIKLSDKDKKKKEEKLSRLQLKPDQINRFLSGQFQNKNYAYCLQILLEQRKQSMNQ